MAGVAITDKGSRVVEALIQVDGQWGLDGQGSARFAVSAARFASEIVCMANGRSVNAKDVMSVMSLRARAGTQVRILATGPDETAALEALSAVLRTQESSRKT
ncbi:MAG: HPr family phosphocarrier protein [Paraburkholderia sp.]|jgi:phosphotransferase system HPr (HPr) family protein|uniref:HPr family phosphocarrier protein n=1 Tax=Paraburkholderia sp. TaxID=1926495 RepID=UPI00397D03F6